MNGRVLSFDRHAGFGTVRAESGGDYFFHCTAIADGTRTIEEGATVTFDIVPGHHGRWEAARIQHRTPS